MKDHHLIIKSLNYTGTNKTDLQQLSLSPGLQILNVADPEATAAVLNALLIGPPACQIHDQNNSFIKTSMLLFGDETTVIASIENIDENDSAIMLPYSEIVERTEEEHAFLCFSQPADYHVRLQQYWEQPEAFAKQTTQPQRTLSLSTTKTFRHHLRRFIHTFSPEPMNPKKDLWLHIEKDGRFSVRSDAFGKEITNLSEADNLVFQYLCFLHIRRFWDGVQRYCRFPAWTLPIVICDFSGKLNDNTNYDSLLQRALDVSAQVIVV